MAKMKAPKPEVTSQETATPPQDKTLISFAEPASPEADVAVADEAPPVSASNDPISIVEPETTVVAKEFVASDKPIEPVLTDREFQALYAAAEQEDMKRDFALKIMKANEPVPEPVQMAGPVPARVMEQTKAEMAAGAAQVAKHAAAEAGRPPRPKDPYNEGRNEAVFRPSDYVPDHKKGQGNVQARTL
jgi:hypothetical protein